MTPDNEVTRQGPRLTGLTAAASSFRARVVLGEDPAEQRETVRSVPTLAAATCPT